MRPPAPRCPDPNCRAPHLGAVRHSRFQVRRSKRQRYRCRGCGKTFSGCVGTPYHRMRYPAELFDRAAALATEGMSKAAIARILRISVGTVTRWLEKAAFHSAVFSERVVRQVCGPEIQADELRSYTRTKKQNIWLHTSLDVESRLWTTMRLGRRTMRDTKLHMGDLRDRLSQGGGRRLMTTDAFKYYGQIVPDVFGPALVYAQVEKSFRDNRVVKKRENYVVGSAADFEQALVESEDSRKLNTSFVERLHLTIRRSLAALQRKTTAYARSPLCLAHVLVLLRATYNFIRPHRALRFGKTMRTPAMQAGLATRPLTYREIFTLPQRWWYQDPARPRPDIHGKELLRGMVGVR